MLTVPWVLSLFPLFTVAVILIWNAIVFIHFILLSILGFSPPSHFDLNLFFEHVEHQHAPQSQNVAKRYSAKQLFLPHAAPPVLTHSWTSLCSVYPSCVSFYKDKQIYVFLIFIFLMQKLNIYVLLYFAFLTLYFLEIIKIHFSGTIYKERNIIICCQNHFPGKLFKEIHRFHCALLPFCSLFSKTEVVIHSMSEGLACL